MLTLSVGLAAVFGLPACTGTASDVRGMGSAAGGGAAGQDLGGVAGSGAAGAPADDASAPDPLAAAPTCTSRRTWTSGEGAQMDPGRACVSCHAQSIEAPRLGFGGTVYPTGHEPDECYGVNGTGSAAGAQVVVTDAAGATFTAAVNASGNFSFRGAVMLPIKAKVVFQGRERQMLSAVPAGDCNACHTQDGTTTITMGPVVKAPGRIVLP